MILNNKGNPVRQFEPFFDTSHDSVFDQKVGVSATLIYDPLDRVVATVNPNHTWNTSVFDNWTSTEYDANDTTLLDPKNDPDIGRFLRLLPDEEYLPTWYDARQSGQLGKDEELAARKAAAHSNTPTVTHMGPLGRAFLSIEDNGHSGKYQTHFEFDIQGRVQQIKDPRDRIVIQYIYDMAGRVINEKNFEAGDRWTFQDVTDGSLYTWDSRNNRIRTERDELRRPICNYLQSGSTPEVMTERVIYGESQSESDVILKPEVSNTRGKIVKVLDQAGTFEHPDYDFKGNLLCSKRQLAQEYKVTLDWNSHVPMEEEIYIGHKRYDALSRVVESVGPDSSTLCNHYDEAGLLQNVTGRIRGSDTATCFVRNIEYNAKGQRTSIFYGNRVETSYKYDANTFALD